MVMTAVELIAAICAVIVLVKTGLLITARPTLFKIRQWIMHRSTEAGIIYMILALLVAWYILQDITIVQLFATVAFSSLFIGAVFLFVAPQSMNVLSNALRDRIPPVVWALIVLWIFLAVLVLFELWISY